MTTQPAMQPATDQHPGTSQPSQANGAADPRRIAATDGPFEVTGLPLVRRHPVETDQGEPVGWSAGVPVDTGEPGEPYYLCRCGQSANKPFCDGSHNTAGVSLADGEDVGNYLDRADDMAGTGVLVRDNRSLCSSAGFCSSKLTSVWDMVGESGDAEVREQMLAMVRRCPSGALTYAMDGAEVEPELPAEVTVQRNGPLLVTGRVRIQRADGTELEVRNRVALCRCGASRTKPLCDGSHNDVGFRDEPGDATAG